MDWFVCNTQLQIGRTVLSPQRLWRRAIGRNVAALSSHAELVWFIDVDHVFGPGCIDALWKIWNEQLGFVSMLYPSTIQIHVDHAAGDACLSKAGMFGLVGIDQAQFTVKRYRKAIGGVQIVPGSLARTYGYLDNHPRYQQPCDRPFPDFRDDIEYRRQCQELGPIVAIKLPALYRIRHTRTTYQPDIIVQTSPA